GAARARRQVETVAAVYDRRLRRSQIAATTTLELAPSSVCHYLNCSEGPLSNQRVSAAHLWRRRRACWLLVARTCEDHGCRSSLLRRSKLRGRTARGRGIRTRHRRVHLSRAVEVRFRRGGTVR